VTGKTLLFELIIPIVKIVAVILYPMLMVIVMIWLERRVVAWIQGRIGPNRVGWQGLLQPLADALKLFFKEDIVQRDADRLLFNIAPILVMF
jgi:NADH-quinone oxidoreductase subunit H